MRPRTRRRRWRDREKVYGIRNQSRSGSGRRRKRQEFIRISLASQYKVQSESGSIWAFEEAFSLNNPPAAPAPAPKCLSLIVRI